MATSITRATFFKEIDSIYPDLSCKEIMSLKKTSYNKLIKTLQSTAKKMGVRDNQIDNYIHNYIHQHLPSGVDTTNDKSTAGDKEQKMEQKEDSLPKEKPQNKPGVNDKTTAGSQEQKQGPLQKEKPQNKPSVDDKTTAQKMESKETKQQIIEDLLKTKTAPHNNLHIGIIALFLREVKAWQNNLNSRHITRIYISNDNTQLFLEIADYKGWTNGLQTLFGKRKYFLLQPDTVSIYEIEHKPSMKPIIGSTAMKKLYSSNGEQLKELATKYYNHLNNIYHGKN